MIGKMWSAIWMLIVLMAIGMSGALFFAPKRVDGYYISHGQDGTGSCVYAHWTWHVDEVAFCSDEYQKALDFMDKANAEVKSGKE